MNEQIITPDQARQVARALFVQLHRGQEEWFDAAWNACLHSEGGGNATSICGRISGLGVGSSPDHAAQQLAKDFVAIAAAFLVDSPVACKQLLERLREKSQAGGHLKPVTDWLCQQASARMPDPKGQFLVWESSAETPGIRSYGPLAQEVIFSQFRERIDDYDIFIDCGSIWVKKLGTTRTSQRPDLQKSNSNLHLLTIFLMNKDRAINTDDLCRQAVGQVLAQKQGDSKDSANLGRLYTRISRFRDWVKPIVPGLSIEMDSSAGGYRCSGPFSSCVIHATDVAPFYDVDLL